jgi:5-methylcytosine-specific restriction endonuclease McrA
MGSPAGSEGRLVKRQKACLCGRVGCQRHLPSWGWASKRDKATRDAHYTSPVYRRIRREWLSKKPPCSVPGCIRPATTLDHIVPISMGGGNERSNLRPMCRRHNEDLGRAVGNELKRRRAKGEWNR